MDMITVPFEMSGHIKYRFTRKVAEGGMGAVYEAEQVGSNGFTKRMAIKVILSKYTDSPEFIDMFIGEAKLVANLVHQNIVQIYHLGRGDFGYFIAMELIDGVNLEQLMLRHDELGISMPIEIATFITSRVCRGLEYAHNKKDRDGRPLGLVHRDVSPKNVMITAEGEVKLTDFGIAKAARYMEQKEGEVLMGKVEYMSPEQASYETTDARSDIFALGIIYHELITGENLIDCDDVFDAIDMVKFGEFAEPKSRRSDVPDDVNEIIMRCLQKDKTKRFQTAGDLGYALEYHMYHKGYGPTIVTLAKYMAHLFPDKQFYAPESRGDNLPQDNA